MVDMAVLLQCRGSMLSPPQIQRLIEGVHALSHTDQGLHLVVLVPASPGQPGAPPTRANQVVIVRSLGQPRSGHLVLARAQHVKPQIPLEPMLETTETCAFDTWGLNVFDKVFLWEEAAMIAAEEWNIGKPSKRLCPEGATPTCAGTP